MDDIPNSAKLFIRLELDQSIPNWKAISKIANVVKEYNDELAQCKERKVQDILNKNTVEYDLAEINTL